MKQQLAILFVASVLFIGCASSPPRLRHPVLAAYYVGADDADPAWNFEVDRHGKAIQLVQYQNHQDWQVRRGRVSEEDLSALLSLAAGLRYVDGGRYGRPFFIVNKYESNEVRVLIYYRGQPDCDPETIAKLHTFYQALVPVLPERVVNQRYPECVTTYGKLAPSEPAPN